MKTEIIKLYIDDTISPTTLISYNGKEDLVRRHNELAHVATVEIIEGGLCQFGMLNSKSYKEWLKDKKS